MKNNKLFKSILAFCLIGIYSVTAFISCEVGLGSAVDTQSPVIEFAENTVTTGAAVRDSFMVFGTWSDDGIIKEVNAMLTSTSGGSQSFPGQGNFTTDESGKGTWNVVFDPAAQQIKDGSYELAISITDQGKHTSKITRAIVIDNTAPLVVLTRPSQKLGSLSFDSYGQKFTLEGKAADDNDVSLIQVNVYADAACSGAPLRTISLPNVPLTIETDVAEYSATEPNDYSVIYGRVDPSTGIAIKDNSPEGTVARYCKLVVYDGAQRYPADGTPQTDADKLGNSIDYYYLNNDLAELFTAGYKITELYHILNGTYESAASRSITTTNVVSTLADASKHVTTGQFKINPENSPHFVVSARNTLPETGIDFADPNSLYFITNGNGQLEVEISTGLDGHVIREETVGVYLLRCTDDGQLADANGNVVASEDLAEKIWLINTGSQYHKTQEQIAAEGTPAGEDYGIYSVSGTTYKFKTVNALGTGSYSSLGVNRNYYIRVAGKDMQGNDIVSEGDYGFRLITSGLNIEVNLADSIWVSKNTAAYESCQKPAIPLTFPSTENQPYDIYRSTVSSSIASTTPIKTNQTGTTIIDDTITKAYITSLYDATKPVYLYYLVKGDNSAQSNNKQIQLKYDNAIPSELTISDLSDPTPNELTSMTISGSAKDADSEIKKVFIQIWDGNSTTPSATTTPAYNKTAAITAQTAIPATFSDGTWTVKITYTDTNYNLNNVFAEKGPKTVKITAVDSVGLTKEITQSFVYDREDPVSQITNEPPAIVSTGITLNYSASDDYKLGKIILEQKKDNDEPEQIIIVDDISTKTKTGETPALPLNSNGTSQTDLTNRSEKYTYTIIAEDATGKQTRSESKIVTLHTQPPTISITKPAANSWQTSNSVTLEGKVASGKTLSGIYYIKSSSAPTAPANPESADSWTSAGWTVLSGTVDAGTNTPWSKTITINDSASIYTYYVGTVDSAGNTTISAARKFYVDASKPALSAIAYTKGTDTTKIAASGTVYVQNDLNDSGTVTTKQKITLYGNYQDAQSGVTALTFKLEKNDETVAVTPVNNTLKYSQTAITGSGSSATIPASNTFAAYNADNKKKYKSWTADFEFTENGKLHVYGENGTNSTVGKTELAVFDILIDTEKPVLQNLKLTENSAEAYTNGTKYFVNNSSTAGKTFKITGISTDDCGVEEVSIKVTNTATTAKDPIENTINKPTGPWEFDISGIRTNNWQTGATVTITAKDKAGRTSTKTINIAFDTVAPKPMHWADKKKKDIYFRIGNADNDKTDENTWETGDAVGTTYNPRNEDVGGKYSYGSWGSNSSIEIRGYFEEADTGSGIKAIYYAIFGTQEALTNNLNNFKNGSSITKDPDNGILNVGSFAPLTETVEKYVPYNLDEQGTQKSQKLVKTNFRTTLPGFDASENFLVLAVEDYAGNRAVDELKVTEGTNTTDNTNNGNAITDGTNAWNSEKAYYGIKKDTKTPEIDTSVTTGKYTNGYGSAITISGTASDEHSGLKNVVVTIDEINITETYKNFTTGSATQNWSVTIPANSFTSLANGKSCTVYAEATDNTGANKKLISAATIYVDKAGPTVTVTSHAADSIVGGTFTLKGTAKDGTGAGVNTASSAKPVLYYTTSSSVGAAKPKSTTIGTTPDSKWVVYGNPSLTNDDWTIDVTIPTTAGENTPIWLSVSAKDKSGSGNTGYSTPLKVTVDKKAPTTKTAFAITDTNKTVNGTAIQTTTWFNSTTLQITGEFEDDGSGVASLDYTLDGTTKSIPSTGAVDSPVSGFTDGTHTLSVQVKDKESNSLNVGSFTVKVDSVKPQISAAQGHTFTETTLANGSQAKTFTFVVSDTGSGITSNAATDTSSAVSVKVGDNKTITHKQNGSSFAVSEPDANGKSTVTVVIGKNDIPTVSGPYSIIVTVTDKAGNESNSTSIGTLSVDTDKPVPTFTSHQASAVVNKTITLRGNITDTSNSEITAIALTASGNSVTKTYGYPSGTNGNITYSNGQWSLNLDTTQFNNTTTAKSLSLSLTATDKAGNTSEAKTLSLTIDQNSDRPVVKFTNLVKDGSKYILKYGNKAALEGTLTDDDATSTDVVKVFKASSSPITSATAATTGTTTFNAATGDFTFEPASEADGEKQVYFYIVDNNDNVFYTTQTASQLQRPYQQYKTDDKEDNNAVFKYNSDSKAPSIENVKLNSYSVATGGTGVEAQLGADCRVGGLSKRYIDISASAQDNNGITGIVVILEQGTTKLYYRSNNKVSETGVTTYAQTGNVTATTNNTTFTYQMADRIDLDAIVNGAYVFAENYVDVTVKVYDQSGLYSNQSSKFYVDRTAPVLTISDQVADNELVYSTRKLTIGGTVGEHTDSRTIYYAVTREKDATSGNDIASSSIAETSTSNEANKWIEIEGQRLSANVVFNGTSSDSGKVSDSLFDWLCKAYSVQSTYFDENDANLKLTIHFKVVDDCGNVGYSHKTIEVVPNANKPTITLSYPQNITVKNDQGNDEEVAPSLAGRIRVYGNAETYDGAIQGIYIQIDTNYNGTTFNATGWKTGFDSLISGKITEYSVEQFRPVNTGKGITGDAIYGIKASGTNSWNLPINVDKEFNPTGIGDDTIRPMAVRIYGVGVTGKVSEYVEQVFNVDPSAPQIGDDGIHDGVMQLKLVQFSSTPTDSMTAAQTQAAISNQMPYKSGTWVKGNWYIAASVFDDSGILSISLDENDGFEKIVFVSSSTIQNKNTRAGNSKIIVKANDCKAAINNVTGKKNFDVYIPLPTGSGSGSVNFTIEAVEVNENANSSTANIKVNYDNTPPKLGTIGHDNYNAQAYNVQQDQGFYRLFGYATDTADAAGSLVSDIKAVAFYFIRRGTSNTRVYDPMYKDGYASGKHNYKEIQTISNGTATPATGISYDYGMYWNQKTVGRNNSDLRILTLTDKDDNIHAGGFVLIGGTIYTISSVSSDGKTITLKTEAPAGITTAKFAYAMVIDNFNMTESTDTRTKITDSSAYGYGYYEADSTADDGDLMQEKWASGKWEAWINSANIPDGPIEIHYVALDNAQNYSVGIVGNLSLAEYQAKTTLDVSANGTPATATNNLISRFDYIYDANKKAYVSNNAPRLAGVTVGTDYNGNGTVEANEKKTKYVAKKNVLFSGASTEVAGDATNLFIASGDNTSSGTAMMAIKGAASIEAEIVGGNGNMYYQYSIDGTTYKDHATIAAITTGSGKFNQNTTAMTITREEEGWSKDDDWQNGYYKSTTLPAITFTEAQIKSAVASNNNKTWFTFEFWDSTEETTKFENSQYAQLKLPLSIQVYDNTPPNTVINDLYWNSATDNSVYTNPSTDKLEGHVELKDYLTGGTFGSTGGYGTDDDKISGKVVFHGYAYDNKRLKTLKWAIVDHNADDTYTNPTYLFPATSSALQNGATFSGGSWTGSGTLNTTHYTFEVSDVAEDGAYLDEKGHKVAWTLTVDTSYIKNVAEKDARIYIYAEDQGSKTTTITNTEVTSNSTDQETYDKTRSRPTYQVDIVPYITGIKSRLDDNRSSNGNYQLADDETGVELIGYNLKQGSENLGITIPTSTGAYSTTVNSCVTINNLNNNNVVGGITDATEAAKVKNKYNYQPSAFNDSLTDDVYIQLWQFNNRAAMTRNGVGFVREPVMAFNTTNGNIGFAFSNGANFFSMSQGTYQNNTTQTSYSLWEKNYAKYVCNALTFDESGRSHGISVGIDTEPNDGKAGRMNYFNSSWGTSDTNASGGNFNNTGNLHIDTIGIPNANDYTSSTPTGGANQWGTTVIMEDRFKSASIIAANHGNNNNATVYIAYYDDILERIVFRWGTITGGRAAYNNLTTPGNDVGVHSFPLANGTYSLIAGGKDVAGTQPITPYNAGEYVDLGLVKGNTTGDDVVCVVWYDAKLGNLMYNYKINPCNQNSASTTYTAAHWAQAKVLKHNCGEYCKIAVDANGGIHITAYDSGNKGVGYVYLPSYNYDYDEDKDYYLIDAMNGPFDELGIDVAVDGTDNTGKAYPTISYYANGTPKMATYSTGITKTSGRPEASWEKDKFTGKWDVCFVPTNSKLLKDHINVVQPRNTAGVRTTSGSSSDFSTKAALNSSNNTLNITNKVTSNGTNNPILGYAIREGSKGYLEIAQRK